MSQHMRRRLAGWLVVSLGALIVLAAGLPSVILEAGKPFPYNLFALLVPTRTALASTLSSMNLWIQMFQFHAGIGGGETPVYSDGFLVPLLHPCLDLPMQGGLVWNPAIQAASHQGTQFNLGHIQPTAVLGRVVELEACSEPVLHTLGRSGKLLGCMFAAFTHGQRPAVGACRASWRR